jgi:ribonuclease Z
MSHRIPTTGFLFAEKRLPRHINLEAADKYQVPYTSFNDLKEGNDFISKGGNVIANSILTNEPEQPRSYAFCSDTVYHHKLAGRIRGCNLIYHEATFMSDMAEVAKAKMHSTSAEAAKVALDSGANKLLIGHFSARYDDLLPLLEEARSVFCETYLAEEGKTYQV